MPDHFDSTFNADWSTMEASIKRHIQNVAQSGETRKAALKAEFDQISATIFQLDHFVSKTAHALPAFELWKHSTCSKQLRSELAHLRSEMLPRQEFQFTNAGDILNVDDPLAQGIRTLTGSEQAPSMICSVDTPDDVSDAAQTTISCLTDAKRVVLTDKLKGKAWTLSDLQVHLRAGSNPIIEGCNRIGFGPLSTLQYQGFDGFCESAELQAGGLHWERVEDFSNPGSEIKKNWYIVK